MLLNINQSGHEADAPQARNTCLKIQETYTIYNKNSTDFSKLHLPMYIMIWVMASTKALQFKRQYAKPYQKLQ